MASSSSRRTTYVPNRSWARERSRSPRSRAPIQRTDMMLITQVTARARSFDSKLSYDEERARPRDLPMGWGMLSMGTAREVRDWLRLIRYKHKDGDAVLTDRVMEKLDQEAQEALMAYCDSVCPPSPPSSSSSAAPFPGAFSDSVATSKSN